MLRMIPFLTVCIFVTLGNVATASADLPIPEGATELNRLEAQTIDEKLAVFVLYADANDALHALAATFKDGAEKNRKEITLRGIRRDEVRTVVLEDADFDDHLEALVLANSDDGLTIRAWEWVGASIYSDPEQEDWSAIVKDAPRTKALDTLRAAMERRAREQREGEIIRDAIDSLVPDAKSCAEKAAARNNLAEVEILIAFTIDERGLVRSATLRNSNLDMKSAEKCVEKLFARLTFKGEVQGPIDIEIPLVFKP